MRAAHQARQAQIPVQAGASGARKYTGEVAEGYDAKREDSAKWKVEQAAVESFLADLEPGTWVLDAPCGTGRFFPFYAAMDFIVRGLDASADMIRLAAAKIANPNATVPIAGGDDRVAQWMFSQGDVRGTSLPDKIVDVAVNVRITRWLMGEGGFQDVGRMLKEMQRLARKRIIFTARVRNHPFAVSYEDIRSFLQGWAIARDVPGGRDALEGPVPDEDYRIIELRPV
jgi:ubiquinone/menaquinone biosynthesis C-methylase UbiE